MFLPRKVKLAVGESLVPSSDYYIIPYIIERLRKTRPQSILDIGIGFGKYGYLAREYTDICPGHYYPHEWQVRIDGIEIFAPYVGKLQRMVYDNIYIGNALDVLQKIGDYDFMLAVDILEHFKKRDGLKFLRLLKQKAKIALVSVPINVRVQKASFGNKHERHLSVWIKGELTQFGNVSEIPKHDETKFLLEIRNDEHQETM